MRGKRDEGEDEGREIGGEGEEEKGRRGRRGKRKEGK